MPLITHRSPKLRFQEDKTFTQAHLSYTDSAIFAAASDAAMLQLLHEMKDTTDPTIAIAYYHRLLGARQYRNILASLAEQDKPVAVKPDTTNLDHQA